MPVRLGAFGRLRPLGADLTKPKSSRITAALVREDGPLSLHAVGTELGPYCGCWPGSAQVVSVETPVFCVSRL